MTTRRTVLPGPDGEQVGLGLSSAAQAWAWPLLALALGLGALALWTDDPANRALWDWQPGLATAQPWRWFTAAGVHLSRWHLGANLLGLGAVALLGWRAHCGWQATGAWAMAWPVTHLGLLAQPDLAHYGGLSGVLHAAVAVVACELLYTPLPRRRWVGGLLLAGLCAKVLSESPWQGPVQNVPGWDIAIAPGAHTSGALAGLVCSGLLRWMARRSPGAASPPTDEPGRHG